MEWEKSQKNLQSLKICHKDSKLIWNEMCHIFIALSIGHTAAYGGTLRQVLINRH